MPIPTPPARPRRQSRLALAVLLAAVGLAACAWPFRARWWGGWVLAVAEAGIVGGLADWFAVTALFRRPLGLPIPHTALIPANWELLAARVGSMVGDRVLSRDYVTAEIARLDLAALLGRAAERLDRATLETAARRILRWAVAEVSGSATDELARVLHTALRAQPVIPLLAWGLEAARREGWDRRSVAAAARALAEAMDRPLVRQAVEALVDDLLARYRERFGVYPRVLFGLADLLGLIDRDRIVAALAAGAREVSSDPEHPLRLELLETMRAWPERLRADAALATRIEAAWAELLGSPAVAELLREAAGALHRALAADVQAPDSDVLAWVVERLEAGRRAVVEDGDLRRDLEAWAKRRLTELVERHHGRIATFIEKGVHALGPDGAVRLVEEHAGEDLQYIRVNGTIVGGLAGGALYALHLLLR
jgi:uncharacterized membrane-anchored protein YjiN (DUF445 family)